MDDKYTDRTTPDQKRQDRQIRVFISSTFKDMHAERELLIKKVFPELRRICAERFVTFTEVDLRWGITEEQAAEGKVLPICLEEINRTRPYFISLLGERYGYIPDAIPEDIAEREPWIKEHVGGRTSVTELEILHGVLNNPEMADHSFFFFRDPDYVNAVPEKNRRDFVAESPQDAEKLKDLKARIRKSGFPVLEDYADPNTLANAVRDQFTILIDKLYPKEEAPDPLDQEATGHEAYGRGKLLAYVERPEHSEVINAFAKATPTGQGLVVTGEPGCGKSALLASWMKHWKENNPEDVTLVHYFGATPESASVPGFLRRILAELKRGFEIEEDIPNEPEKLAEALPVWLAQASAKLSLSPVAGEGQGEGANLILVLDALNQIEGGEPDRRLSWLPRFFPENVRVIASALPGPALEALQERSWSEHHLPLSNAAERSMMIQAFLGIYRKTLRSDMAWQLAGATGAANPLFLRTVLEELRQFGSFEQLPARVAHYLEAQTPEALFQRVLRRWQEDFGDDLVRRALCHLWAARQGLSESNLLDFMADRHVPMDRQMWRPIFLAFEPHLVQRSGLWTFGHIFLRRAVATLLLPTEQARNQAHLSLAEYFQQSPPGKLETAELLWQLAEAKAWDRLHTLLTDLDALKWMLEGGLQEFLGFWRQMEPQYDLTFSYATVWEQWSEKRTDEIEIAEVAEQLGQIFYAVGRYEAAETYYRRAVECRSRVQGDDHPDMQTTLNNLAGVLMGKGDYTETERLYRTLLNESQQSMEEDNHFTYTCMTNLSVALNRLGRHDEAEILSRRAFALTERVFGFDHQITLSCCGNLAFFLSNKGNYAEAEQYYRRCLESSLRVFGRFYHRTLIVMDNLSSLLTDCGKYKEAENLYRLAQEGFESILGEEHPDTLVNYNDQGILLEAMGRHAQAERMIRRALDGRLRVLGECHPDTLQSMYNLSALLFNKDETVECERILRYALNISSQVFGRDHPKALVQNCKLAALLAYNGDSAEAANIYRQAYEGLERAIGGEHSDTLLSMEELAMHLATMKEYNEAELLLRRALMTRQKLKGEQDPDTLRCLKKWGIFLGRKGDMTGAKDALQRAFNGFRTVLGHDHQDTKEAELLLKNVQEQSAISNGRIDHVMHVLERANSEFESGRFDEAADHFRQVSRTFEKSFGSDDPRTLDVMGTLASMLGLTGDYVAAEAVYRKVLKEKERKLGRDHPSALLILCNLGELLRRKGDLDEAEELFLRTINICDQASCCDHRVLASALSCIADLLNDKGDLDAAEQMFERAIAIKERSFGKDHAMTLKTTNNYARVLWNKGDLVSAEKLFRRTANALARVLGDNHPDTLATIGNLACVLLNLGELAAAEPLFQRAVHGLERVLGSDHPTTLNIIRHMAVLHHEKGDDCKAEIFLRKVLAAREKMICPDHPDLLNDFFCMAKILERKGDQSEANKLLRRVLEGKARTLGWEHWSTVDAADALAAGLIRQPDFEGAKPLLQRVLSFRKATLGSGHPNTIDTLNALALVSAQVGDVLEAALLMDSVIDQRNIHKGLSKSFFTTCRTVAAMLANSGEREKSELLLKKSVQGLEEKAGSDDPDTLQAVRDLGMLLVFRADIDGSVSNLQRVAEGYRRILGRDHEHTIHAYNELAQILRMRKEDNDG